MRRRRRVYLGFGGNDAYEPDGGAHDLHIVTPLIDSAKHLLESEQASRVSIFERREGYQFTQEMVDARIAEQGRFRTTTSEVELVPHWVPERPARVNWDGWAHILEDDLRGVRYTELDVELVSDTRWRWVWSDLQDMEVLP